MHWWSSKAHGKLEEARSRARTWKFDPCAYNNWKWLSDLVKDSGRLVSSQGRRRMDSIELLDWERWFRINSSVQVVIDKRMHLPIRPCGTAFWMSYLAHDEIMNGFMLWKPQQSFWSYTNCCEMQCQQISSFLCHAKKLTLASASRIHLHES